MKKITFSKAMQYAIVFFLLFISSQSTFAQYCVSNGNGTDGYVTGTRRVILNTLDNATPVEDNAYSDFTAMSTTLIVGDSYDLSVYVNTDGNFTVGTVVWIDWNNNEDFTDAGETYNMGATTNTANGATGNSPLNITVPAGASLGNTRMRVSTRFNAYPGPCNTGFDGEVEDYTVNISSGVPAPEMYVSGNGLEITDGDTTPATSDWTNFGGTDIGTPLMRTFTIENTGTLNLTVGTPTITGPGSGQFTLTTSPTSPLTPSTSTTFSITYNPVALATDNATVTITNNDADENPYTFAIRGTGIDSTSQIAIYCEDFNANNGGWSSTTSTNGGWNYGTEGTASGGATGNYVYTQRSGGLYQNNSHQVYTSPNVNLSGYENLNFSIDLWYDMSNDSNPTTPTPDGFQIQFTDDGGATWYALGGTGEGDNWYTSEVVYNFGTFVGGNPVYVHGWTGNSGGWITASIDLQSQGFDNKNNIQFRVDFRSDGGTRDVGVAFDNVCITGYGTQAVVDPSCGPAGIGTNLALWLRADGDTSIASGTDVNTWEDQAFGTALTRAESPSGEEPTFHNDIANNINFNPVIKFDGTTSSMYGKKGFYSDEFYIVVKPRNPITYTSAPNDIYCGDDYRDTAPSEDVTGFEMGNTSARFNNDVVAFNLGPQTDYGVAEVSTTQTFSEASIFNGRTNASNNGADLYCDGQNIGNQEANVGSFTRISNSRYWLGRSEVFGASFDGDIMEVISYSGTNTIANQQKIQSYLALKYGITLGTNGTSLDYVDSDGNTIWDVSADSAAFNYDIAGIGRDDCSSLNQKQSKSVNTTSLITMGLTDIYDTNSANTNTFANDKNYLVWGRDNGDLGASAPIVVDMSFGIPGVNSVVDFIAVQRSWRVQETGNVGMTKISLPEIALTATITPPGAFLMFISDTPDFNPTSEYRIMSLNGSNLETEYDFNGTKYITFGYAPEYIYNRAITFDGTRDYLDAGDNLGLPGDFTISAWVKNIGGGTILSKRDAAFTEGYELRINGDGTVAMEWINGGSTSLTTTATLPNNEWHQIAVTCHGINTTGSGEANIFIDGVLAATAIVPVVPANNQSFLMGAADAANPTSFYSGTLDEVLIWDTRLTLDQLHFTMNQELEEHTDGTVRGKIIPQNISKNEVSTIPWSDLAGYFPMNRYTFTNIRDESNSNLVATIKNLDTVDEQTAPLPYVSTANGDWNTDATWENGAWFQNPDATSVVDATQRIDWNIVQTSHDISTQTNNTVLGLDITSNELSIENDSKMEVSHYLRLNGNMDLVGESQLVQTENSDLDPTSFGQLEKDQDGTADMFTYNYWTSPVSTINNSDNNQDFTIASLLHDGSDVNNPLAITYTGAYDGAPGSPITLSAYWFFKYDNQISSTYSAWQYVGPSGNMQVGEGWTMKGPGTGGVTDAQNYTFIGKPNNSTTADNIALTVNGGNDYLIGNPFSSALDADDFIADNPNLDGTLYFWEHWGGGSHYLQQYQGGYAMYNLSGGTPAVSHPSVSQTGTGTKTPERYVAVGQGFFVKADNTGPINFSNTQRNFVKEGGSSVFMFTDGPSDEVIKTAQKNTSEQPDDTIYDEEDTRLKFRVGFDAPSGLHRQLLITRDENTTFGYDKGYDGVVSDIQGDDMTWAVEDRSAIIQGAPNFVEQNLFPLNLQLATGGEVKIGLDGSENYTNPDLKIILWDQLSDTYTMLTDGTFTINLSAGNYDNRFAIVFKYKGEEPNDDTDTDDQDDDTDTDDQDDDTDTDDQDDDTDTDDQDDDSDTDNQDDDTDTDDEDDDSDTDDQDPQEKPTDTDTQNDEKPGDGHINKTQTQLDAAINASYSKPARAITVTTEVDTEVTKASLFNMLGQLIKQWDVNANEADLRLPVQEISSGSYVLSMETTFGVVAKKLVIH